MGQWFEPEVWQKGLTLGLTLSWPHWLNTADIEGVWTILGLINDHWAVWGSRGGHANDWPGVLLSIPVDSRIVRDGINMYHFIAHVQRVANLQFHLTHPSSPSPTNVLARVINVGFLLLLGNSPYFSFFNQWWIQYHFLNSMLNPSEGFGRHKMFHFYTLVGTINVLMTFCLSLYSVQVHILDWCRHKVSYLIFDTLFRCLCDQYYHIVMLNTSEWVQDIMGCALFFLSFCYTCIVYSHLCWH